MANYFNKMYLYDMATGGDRLAGGLYTIATIDAVNAVAYSTDIPAVD